MTIHSFAWELIRQFEQELKQKVLEFELLPENVQSEDFDKVQYELGARYVIVVDMTIIILLPFHPANQHSCESIGSD